MMTRSQAVAVATAVQQVRPEWDHPGILAALQAAQGHGPPAEAAAAACRLASNLKLRNPGMLSQPGAHWRAPAEGGPTVSVVVTRCGEHPEHPAARCPACEVANRGEVVHQAGVAAVREALRSAAKYVEPAVKAARAAERRGA